MRNNIKITVFTAVFGSLWGICEMFLGTYLHMLNVPLRGAFMAGIGAVILSSARLYVNFPGSSLFIGLTASAIKLFSFGAFKLGPVAGILIESFIADAVFSVAGFSSFSICLVSVLACLEGIPHFFVTSWIIYGGGIFDAYLKALQKISAIFGFKKELYVWVFFLWSFAHLIIGAFFSFVAVKTVGKLKNEI